MAFEAWYTLKVVVNGVTYSGPDVEQLCDTTN